MYNIYTYQIKKDKSSSKRSLQAAHTQKQNNILLNGSNIHALGKKVMSITKLITCNLLLTKHI